MDYEEDLRLEWHDDFKNEPFDEMHHVGNVARSWQWRERGLNPPHFPSNKTVLENAAEDILVQKSLQIRSCDLPGYPRSTFLMVFSPDGTKVASTHGNHNVYVSELASGKHVRILKGHPRTPWCITFHPSHPLLIGSGCLGGQVRVWDIASGGSEVWNVRNETVIASIAFHPREQLLVIATYNELYFWDWSQPAPFTKVCTNNLNEKVRYVAFDALGYKLITGISLWPASGSTISSSLLQQAPIIGPQTSQSNNTRRDDSGDTPGGSRTQETSNPSLAQDMIVNSYQNLVQRYDSLVRNYQRLFMVRQRITNTPPPPSTIDRGTDPMETNVSGIASTSGGMHPVRILTPTLQDEVNSTPSSSSASSRQDLGDNGDSETSSGRLLNLDVLSINNDNSGNQSSSNQERSVFGSRSSAFHPLSGPERSFRTVDQNEQTTRLLPNPFSSTSGTRRPSRANSSDNISLSANTLNTSRTSIFTSSRESSLGREYTLRRRNFSPLQHGNDPLLSSANAEVPFTQQRSYRSDRPDNMPSTSGTSTQRPTMTNSSTQMSPVQEPVDTQAINESLDLIRDILRDSGTRLLNLITNMSLSTLASVERSNQGGGAGSHTNSDESESGGRTRGGRPRVRLFSSSWRRDLFSSSSDTDSDYSPEVNIFRTRNTTYREDESRTNDGASTSRYLERSSQPTDRMVFDLYEEARNGELSSEGSRFRVRIQNDASRNNGDTTSPYASESPGQGPSAQSPPDFDPDRSSTSRDDFARRGRTIPSDEAYRKVKSGVNALQKHTVQLTNLWLRGNRTTLRELRTMWENLRRRVLTLQREMGNQHVTSYYTRPLLDRCMMLSDMTDRISRGGRNSRANLRNGDNERIGAEPTAYSDTNNETLNSREDDVNTSTNNIDENRPSTINRSSQIRTSSSSKRRVQSGHRWRPDEDVRRRSRNSTVNRLAPRYVTRPRSYLARAMEISATRHEIRMRAMQVLSIMFNMMMMCLEERGLSQLIITMLRTLKRALALTCLIVMSNRNTGRTANSQTSAPQPVESLDVVRIQNVDHNVDVNVDEPDEPTATNPQSTTELVVDPVQNNTNGQNSAGDKPSTSKSDTKAPSITKKDKSKEADVKFPSPRNTASQKWSNRLAVQIAAANRNNSVTARNRRDLYLEGRRQKALHRTNPIAHPLIRRRALPPVSNYRIPALRCLPTGTAVSGFRSSRLENNNDPMAGPSNAPPRNNSNLQQSLGNEVINEFEHRVNFIRLAHMQAVRLRNAARNGFRRLQTIRLYTPSSVREMFGFQTNDGDSPPENRTPGGNPESSRQPIAMFRPHILTPQNEVGESNEQASLNNVSVPLMQTPNDQPGSSNASAAQPQRLPRIHDYLQPIILAQNAMVMEEGGGGGETGGNASGGGGAPGGAGGSGMRRMSGMAGLLDAGIISEALPAPSHRVQAWDFTSGKTPDISDSTKNVVVQRCRIHNDASIDISKDGRLLVALLPVPRLRNTNHWLGIYSLEWARLGQCLHTAVLEQSAVSVALSPTARHLAVGLGSRRFITAPHARNNVFALLYRLEPLESSSRTGLSPIRELEQNWEHGFTSLNCLRWAPQPGQGLVYANNTGQLIIMS